MTKCRSAFLPLKWKLNNKLNDVYGFLIKAGFVCSSAVSENIHLYGFNLAYVLAIILDKSQNISKLVIKWQICKQIRLKKRNYMDHDYFLKSAMNGTCLETPNSTEKCLAFVSVCNHLDTKH